MLFPTGRRVRPGMARALYGTFPAFRREFDTVCRALDPRLSLPLAVAVFAPERGVDTRLLHRMEFGRAALFAYQVALFRMWQDWGLRVGAVAGDGIGALTAAHVTGRLGLPVAARRALTARRLREREEARAVRALRTTGLRRVLACGPGAEGSLAAGTEGSVAVGDVPGLLTAVAELQLCGPRIDWEGLWKSGHPDPEAPGAAAHRR
ncbi:acyltransferase domain-containing protein [Streptomyces sp. NPDC021356]|uniref:acyltransferase domain-containing protein n=1 Tax=Streptomyces sp. NPDC021356 TaxID=3154900 RepID=UPI00340D11B5